MKVLTGVWQEVVILQGKGGAHSADKGKVCPNSALTSRLKLEHSCILSPGSFYFALSVNVPIQPIKTLG